MGGCLAVYSMEVALTVTGVIDLFLVTPKIRKIGLDPSGSMSVSIILPRIGPTKCTVFIFAKRAVIRCSLLWDVPDHDTGM